MFLTLLKKQLLELGSFLFRNKKTGKRRGTAGVIGFCSLFVFLFISVAFAFFGMAMLMCEPFESMGLKWFYYATMGMIAIAIGTFGSVLTTYTALYKSKDNELLISMPIPPMYILSSRILSVYMVSLIYSSAAWLPAIVCSLIETSPTALSIVFMALLTFIIAAFVTVLTCILGFVVALISSRLKNKTFATVLITVVLLGGYYFVYFRLNTLLQQLVANGEHAAATIKTWVWPIYQMGLAATGEITPMLFFTAMTLILLAIVCYVLARTFIRLALSKGSALRKGTFKYEKAQSVSAALLKREGKRFISSSTYMLNSGLGLLIMPVVSVIMLVKADTLNELIDLLNTLKPTVLPALPVISVAMLGLIVSMNCISAPSVSLEGKNMWILQTLPIRSKKILLAKLTFDLLCNIPVTVASCIIIGIAFKLSPAAICLITFLELIYVYFVAVFGLYIGTVKANLTWTNEVVPIKQGLPITLTLLGGWGLNMAIAAGAVFITFMPVKAYAAIVYAMITAASVLLTYLLLTKGADKFDHL